MFVMNEERKRVNPFFEPYHTPHDTAPFDRIRMEDYEEAFMRLARPMAPVGQTRRQRWQPTHFVPTMRG